MKKIILKYSSLPLFENFNGGNRESILLFESLNRREWVGRNLKTSNFHSSQNWEE